MAEMEGGWALVLQRNSDHHYGIAIKVQKKSKGIDQWFMVGFMIDPVVA